jgi:hypothetical protein
MHRALLGIALSALLFAVGCQQVQEPWTRADNPLEQERARPDDQKELLQHRLMWVQTDR